MDGNCDGKYLRLLLIYITIMISIGSFQQIKE